MTAGVTMTIFCSLEGEEQLLEHRPTLAAARAVPGKTLIRGTTIPMLPEIVDLRPDPVQVSGRHNDLRLDATTTETLEAETTDDVETTTLAIDQEEALMAAEVGRETVVRVRNLSTRTRTTIRVRVPSI
jgi:hypothetical protein